MHGVTARWRAAPLASPTLLSVRAFSEVGDTGSIALLYGVQDARNHYRAELYPMAGVARIIRVLDGAEGLVACCFLAAKNYEVELHEPDEGSAALPG